MAAAARMSGASVVNSAWRSWAPGTEATTPPVPACGAAVSVAVAVGAGAIVGRFGSTADGLSGRAVGSRARGSRPMAPVEVPPVSVVSATATGCATATGVAPIAVPNPATTRTEASAHPVTAVRPIRMPLFRTAPEWSAPRASTPRR